MEEIDTQLSATAVPWYRYLLFTAWLSAGAVALVFALRSQLFMPLLDGILAPLSHHVAADKAVYSPLVYFALLSLVYFLERRVPVQRQAFFSASFCQDALWYAGSMLFRVLLLGGYVSLLHALYHQYFTFLTVDTIAAWHPALRFLLAVLITDFSRWLSHLIRHKVPLFWAFHAVHHSQQNLNLFTDARVHPVDRMISSTLRFIPLLMLGNDVAVIMVWAIFETVYPKFYHGNIKLNLGPLRYVLVTPQSHRVHHACESPYRDKNFGFTFSIWDRLFGTHYHNDSVYPVTGVHDPGYAREERPGPLAQANTFLHLLTYPFLQALRINPRRGR